MNDYIGALPPEVKEDILVHVNEDAPREACGLVVIKNGRVSYTRCSNVAVDPTVDFVISPNDIIRAEVNGSIAAVVHSHPYALPKPSEADRVKCEESGLPWIIVNYPNGDMAAIEPTGYEAPLEGREYHYGVLDCYTIIRDYYKRFLGINLPDFDRPHQWWDRGMNLYMDNYKKAGFVGIEQNELKVHDLILFQHNAIVPNHSGIFIGDNMFLHHFMGRLSSRDIFDGYWRKIAVRFLRHGSLM